MIWNLGSINIDNFYYMQKLAEPGETVAAERFAQGLGGKGANMSVAAARAGARTAHLGAVGPDGKWTTDRLLEYGVDTRHIHDVDTATGHANIMVETSGENCIVIFAGANNEISEEMIGAALSEASTGDTLLMQNETLGQVYAAQTAKSLGLRVVYALAPFWEQPIVKIADKVDLLVLNEVEMSGLQKATGQSERDLPIDDIVLTLGAKGCRWISNKGDFVRDYDAYEIEAVDTTGAGDTFTGYLVAALDRGFDMDDAIDLASKAGALMATRHGTADVIPDLKEVQDHDFG